MSDALPKLTVWIGSLRQASWNRKLFEATARLAEGAFRLEPFDLGPLPHFNADLDAHLPRVVEALKADLYAAQGLLIVSPEYNYGFPALVKNGIEWCSRPPRVSPLKDKPVGLMGASISNTGTIRAQLQLRQVLLGTQSRVLPGPEVVIGRVQEKFDAEGVLTDEATERVISAFLEAFGTWMRKPV